MTRPRKPWMQRALLLTPLVGCASCYGHYHDDPDPAPVFFEVESNDTPTLANDFGLLRPGDLFLIEGRITDTGFDPFDGFAFTSAQPIHVDFQLFIDNVAADLDVCLYDPLEPLNGGIVDCWQTSDNPEQGGVDVTGTGTNFQLVVESFVGSSTYALEIFVDHLAPTPAAIAGPTSGGALRPTGALSEPDRETRFDRYGRAGARGVVIETQLEIDTESGTAVEITTVRPAADPDGAEAPERVTVRD